MSVYEKNIFTMTPEQRAERLRLAKIAEDNARQVLKRGDRITVTKCPGTKRTITFDHWDGCWIVSKSGISDCHPVNVSKLNGQPIDLKISKETS